ncbi:hypothetical protein ACQ27_gp646 [Klebsiella phage K64-1]|nr:hypothetical protein ACQ27_gp646 [Klebsiella phage K64-1]
MTYQSLYPIIISSTRNTETIKEEIKNG